MKHAVRRLHDFDFPRQLILPSTAILFEGLVMEVHAQLEVGSFELCAAVSDRRVVCSETLKQRTRFQKNIAHWFCVVPREGSPVLSLMLFFDPFWVLAIGVHHLAPRDQKKGYVQVHTCKWWVLRGVVQNRQRIILCTQMHMSFLTVLWV